MTVTRTQFVTQHADKSIDAAALRGGSRAGLERADRNGDGRIEGAAELKELFRRVDTLDRNGTYASVDTRNLQVSQAFAAIERATQPRRGLRPGGTDTTTQPDVRAPTGTPAEAPELSRSSVLGRRYQGGGDIKVAPGNKAVQFSADMDVDTDGGTSALAKSDRYYQSQTSMSWKGGKALDASKLPFIVLPPSLAKATGAKLGDLVEVRQGDKAMYAIYGDNGPGAKIGEASLWLAQQFDGRAGPNRAAAGQFTYTVLPGSGREAGIVNGGAPKTAAEIEAAGAAAFARARAAGILR